MKNKKLFAILTLVCFLFTLMPVAAFAENSANITPNFTGNNKVYNETTGVYYEDLAAAVNATTGAAVLYCKADADVSGSNFTHISVHYDLTIYGNGAKITNGEHDLAIDTYDKNGKSAGLERDVTIKVYELNGIALWGQRQTEYTVNAYFENCKDMNRIYISGKKGTNNIELVNCTFNGGKCAIYSNAKGEIKISGCTFTNVQEPINLNNKSADKQKITVSNCTFDTCGSTNDVDKDYAAPIRVLATTEGGTSELNVNSCTFTNTAGNNGDILLGEGRTGKDAKGIVKADVADTNAIVEMQKPGDANKTDNAQIEVTKDETTKLTSVVAKIGDKEYATLDAAIKAANNGDTIDLLGNAIQLKDEYQKTGVSITKNITFTNGTFDISAVGTGEGANCYGVFGLDGKNVTFDKVNFIGSDYKSGMGVIYAIGASTVTLKDCSFEISNDSHEWGGVLKGGNVANDKFIIENCKFNVTNVQRVITNAVVEITGSTIVAKTNDDKYVNHALCNVAGTISDSTITVDGFENGIKNDSNLNLELKDNSHVTLKNCDGKGTDKGYDLYLKDGATIDIDSKSTLIFDTKNIEDTAGILLNGKKVDSVYTLTFVWNIDGKADTTIMVEGNTKATKPEDPTKSGYIFKGWYTTEDCTGSAYSFDTAVTENTTLYAKWNKKSTSSYSSGSSATVTIDAVDNATVKVNDKYAKKGDTVTITINAKDGYYPESIVVTDKNGNAITVTRTGLNEYQFTMPSGKVNIDVDMKAYTSQVVLQIGNTNVVKNGTTVNNDVAPFIQDGRTMVPIRVIVEQLGGVVAWDEATRTVTLMIDGKVLTMVIDEVIPGFDTAATIVDGRTYVPIRYIMEAVGADVEWIAATNQIVIVK